MCAIGSILALVGLGTSGTYVVAAVAVPTFMPMQIYFLLVSWATFKAALNVVTATSEERELLRQRGRDDYMPLVARFSPVTILTYLSELAMSLTLVLPNISVLALAAIMAMQGIGEQIKGTFETTVPPAHAATAASSEPAMGGLLFAGAILTIVWFATLFVGVWISALLREASRRVWRRDAETAMQLDKRPPILLLRSFHDDQVALPTKRHGVLDWIVTFSEKARSLDTLLIDEFSEAGPIIAVDRPDDKRPPYGAARLYLPEDDWKSEVLNIIEAASLVIIVVDDTDSLKWEIAAVAERKLCHKCLLIAQPRMTFAFEEDRRISTADLAEIFDRMPIELNPFPNSSASASAVNCFAVLGPYTDHMSVMRSSSVDLQAYRIALRWATRLPVGNAMLSA